jgi:hypothetical protein
MGFFDRCESLDNIAGHANNGGVEDMTEGGGINDAKVILLGSRVAFYHDGDGGQTLRRGFIVDLPENVDDGQMIEVAIDFVGFQKFNKKDILGKWDHL